MATKKQKRAAGEARQALHREQERANGLKAQKRDREWRQKKAADTKAAQAKKKLTAEQINKIAGNPQKV